MGLGKLEIGWSNLCVWSIMIIRKEVKRSLLSCEDAVWCMLSPLRYVGADQAPHKKVTKDQRDLWD